MQNNKEDKENKEEKTLFDETKSELVEYVEKSLKNFKLKTYEKAAITSSYATYAFVIILMAYFIFFMLLLALGYLLGEWLNSNAAGFGILIALSSLCLFVFIKRGKTFRRYIANLAVTIIRKIESNEE